MISPRESDRFSAVVGGAYGHYFRRLVHVGFLSLFPWISFHWGGAIASFFGVSWAVCLLLVLGVFVIFELLRIRFKWVAYGQRQHERAHICSMSWAIFAVVPVLLLAPKVYAYAIMLTCAWVDPLMGEMRLYHQRPVLVALCGFALALGIWLGVLAFFSMPIGLAFVCAPLMVLAEWPSLFWIDDNALMMLAPLIVLQLFQL